MAPSIVLIGMPGAGKSTVGVLLAKLLAKNFLDTDIEIELRVGKTLNDFLREDGWKALREEEKKVILDLKAGGTVIATGGSAVYSEDSMAHLASLGRIVFIKVPLDELKRRIQDCEDRGIANPKGQSFEDIFAERMPLYEKYAQATVVWEPGQSADTVAQNIAKAAQQ